MANRNVFTYFSSSNRCINLLQGTTTLYLLLGYFRSSAIHTTTLYIQYRSRGTYTRVSSTSGCAREFVGVKLDNCHSSPRTRAPLEDETTRTRAPLEDRAIRTRRPNYSHSKTTQGAWPIGAAVVSASVHGNPVSL